MVWLITIEKFNLFRAFLLDVASSLMATAKMKDQYLEELIWKKKEIFGKFDSGERLIDDGLEDNKQSEKSVHYFKYKVKTVDSNLGRRGLSPSHIAGVDPLRAVRCPRSLSPKANAAKGEGSPKSMTQRSPGFSEAENEKRHLLNQVLKKNFSTLKNVPYTDEGENCGSCGPKNSGFYNYQAANIKMNAFREKEDKKRNAQMLFKNIDLIRYHDKINYSNMILNTHIDDIDKIVKIKLKKQAQQTNLEKRPTIPVNMDDSTIKKLETLEELKMKDVANTMPHLYFLKSKIIKINSQNSLATSFGISPKSRKKYD